MKWKSAPTQKDTDMAQHAKKLPVETTDEPSRSPALSEPWRPLETLRQQVDRLFEDFGRTSVHFPLGRSAFDIEPFWKRNMVGHGIPAVDIAKKDRSFEISVELPGMEEKNIKIRLANGNLSISGDKRDAKRNPVRTTTSRKGTMALSRDFSAYPKASTRITSRRASEKGF